MDWGTYQSFKPSLNLRSAFVFLVTENAYNRLDN